MTAQSPSSFSPVRPSESLTPRTLETSLSQLPCRSVDGGRTGGTASGGPCHTEMSGTGGTTGVGDPGDPRDDPGDKHETRDPRDEALYIHPKFRRICALESPDTKRDVGFGRGQGRSGRGKWEKKNGIGNGVWRTGRSQGFSCCLLVVSSFDIVIVQRADSVLG